MSAPRITPRIALRRAGATMLVALAVLPAAAFAQGGPGAPHFRDRFTEEFVDDDFCETSATVQVVEEGVFNGWKEKTPSTSRSVRGSPSPTAVATAMVGVAEPDAHRFLFRLGTPSGVDSTATRPSDRIPGVSPSSFPCDSS
jgi:hypothetical protein